MIHREATTKKITVWSNPRAMLDNAVDKILVSKYK